jgi:hypothetical protein
MSSAQNLAYSVVQVFHNFGAVAALGGSLAAGLSASADAGRKSAWLALAGWATQAASGAAFGAVSFYFYHRLPDIAGVAVGALVLKMLCAATALPLLAAYLLRGAGWTRRTKIVVSHTAALLSAIALGAAAVLRWFS